MRAGWFTGKGLSLYINTKETDYKNARRIVNGTDKASHIAGIAQSIEKCLRSSVADNESHVSDKGADDEAGEGQTPAPTNPDATDTSVTSKTTTTQTDDAAGKTKTVTEETPSLITRLKTSTTFAQSVGINVTALGTAAIAFFLQNYRVMLGTAAVVVAVFLIYNWRESKRGK